MNYTRYAIVYFLAAVGLGLLGWVLPLIAGGLSLPTGLNAILPPVLAAMVEGQRYARSTGNQIPGNAAWSAAFRMTGIVALINGLFLFWYLLDPDVRAGLGSVRIGLAIGIAVVLIGVTLPVNRYFLTIAAGTELRAIAKRGGK